VFGNMIGSGLQSIGAQGVGSSGTGFGNQSTINAFEPFGEAESAWYAQRFYVDFDTSIASLGFNAKVGRVGYKINRYMFQRQDNTPYFQNDRWDDGEWMFDGAIIGFRFGAAKLNIFGGRNSDRLATNGSEIQPMWAGNSSFFFDPFGNSREQLEIDQSLGAHLQFPLGDRGAINLAYLWLDSNTVQFTPTEEEFNRVVVYGGDVNFQLGGNLGLMAGYAKSNLHYNDESVLDEDNSAWWAGLRFGGGERWGIGATYRSIDPLYAAPGAWGRIGTLWNPVDLEGFSVNAHLMLGDNLTLHGMGSFMKGRGTDVSALTEDDEVTSFRIGVDYKMSSTSSATLGYEHVAWDFDGAAEPTQTWFTVGFNFGLSANTNLRLFWQMSEMDSDEFAPFLFARQGFDAKGGLIGTQLSVKF
jgi:hypothetical protein